MKRINYILFLLLGIAIMYTGCDDDNTLPISKSNCKIKSVVHRVMTDIYPSVDSINFQYDDQGLLIKSISFETVRNFEYNAQGLVTKISYGDDFPDKCVWKYTEGVLSEVEVHSFEANPYSYFFTFDNLHRLTKLTSNKTNDYISYSWRYSGNSRNPYIRFKYLLKSGSPPGTEYICGHIIYVYDDKKNPEADLQGFQVSYGISGELFNPIPENNITKQEIFFSDPDYLGDDYYYTIAGVLATTYEYNEEGYPLKGTTTDGYTPPFYQDDATFTYQVCE